MIEGEEPIADDEFALDEDSAEDAGFEIGDMVTITGPAGAKEYTLTRITEFRLGYLLGGASLALFTLPEAQRLTNKEGRFDEIDIVADDGIPLTSSRARWRQSSGGSSTFAPARKRPTRTRATSRRGSGSCRPRFSCSPGSRCSSAAS